MLSSHKEAIKLYTNKMALKNQPIGIFDSGVGGLTVANAIKQALPGESLIYFGDTAHLPYGDKSAEAIIGYSSKIADFLVGQNAKVVLIACNSASASAYEHLKEIHGDRVIVMDVIDPVVDFIGLKSYSKIGVIGTKRTIESATYAKKLNRINPDLDVVSLPTPLLVPMIEEGFIFDDISNAILRAYLTTPKLNGIEALILGCTHYPIIRNQINKIFNFEVDILDTAGIVSSILKKRLEERDLLNDTGKAKYSFYVSDYTPFFEKIARMFFDGDILLEKSDIWS
jgi:glutamate racemase